MDRSFQYRSDIQEIPTIRKDLEFLNTEWSIAKSETRQILLIIEEIFSNIVRYGFIDDKNVHLVDIRLGFRDNRIEIEIIDDGIAFNPLEYQLSRLPDPTTSDAGGMGLSLIRTFSSQIEYERISGKNYLKITKKVKIK